MNGEPKDAALPRVGDSQSPAESDRRTLLLIEPNPVDRARLATLLAPDYELHVLQDADAGRDALQSRDFACVLLDADAVRPRQLESLRRAADEKSCGLVVMTQVSDTNLTETAIRRGAHDCVAKDRLSRDLIRHVVWTAQSSATRSRELNGEREGFLASIYHLAHDLRAPVRRIRFRAEELRDASAEESDRATSEEILAAADDLDSLVDAFVRYASSDRVSRPAGEVDLNAVIRQASLQVATAAEVKGATIESDPLPSVLGDFDALALLFENLFDNALKFNERVPEIRVSAREDGEQLVVTVRDNGIGVEPRNWKKVFQPFVRLHGQAKYKGAGLGLACCERIARAHGGEIGMASVLGEGSEIMVSLRRPGADDAHGASAS